MVYDFTNPIYILLMILLFGVPIVTPVITASTAVLPPVLIWKVS